ncbi:hypothetical protein EV426DRAFT_717345 [Tirmania nivea]|nr:hypothetical protein EV426DRAFT_717345 [Tirmania nivea]
MKPSLDAGNSQLPETPEGDPPQEPKAVSLQSGEVDLHNTSEASEKPNAVAEVIEDCHGKPLDPQMTKLFSRASSTTHSAILLCYIIAGNCACSGAICLCLWGFSKIDNFTGWQKRAFNAVALLLSAALGFGIGYLCDSIGLLARGRLLQSKPHSVEEIAYIMKGTLSSYAAILMNKVRARWGFVTPTTWVLFLYLLGSLFGRFGVAFLGFAFNLEDSPHFSPALFRPNWANGTVNGDYSHYTDLASLTDRPFQLKERALWFTDPGSIWGVAQAVMGLPWLLEGAGNSAWDYNDNLEMLDATMDISYFENDNFTMKVLDGNTVSFQYKFQDFRGTTAVFAGWEALLETSCRRLDTTLNVSIPLHTINTDEYPRIGGDFRWIHRLHSGPRERPVQMWLTGHSTLTMEGTSAGTDITDRYGAMEEYLFNCSLYFVDSRIDSRPVPLLDVHDEVSSMLTVSEVAPVIPKVRLLGRELYDILRRSPAISAGTTYDINGTFESFRDFLPTQGFGYGIKRKDQSVSELWLAAYLGNYIGNCLSYLNDFLQRIEIEPEVPGIKTKLLVKWSRVATTLGSLAVFQVLFGLAALLYCRRSVEIVDDVSTFCAMFTDFPFHSEDKGRQEGAVYQHKFVTEGGGFRLVCIGCRKTSEVE